MSETSIIVMVAIAGLVGLFVGHIVGEQHGRDAQWCDDYMDRAREANRRRDAYGRFTSTRRATP